MFDQLFRCSSAVERHLAGPLAEPRLRFLTHLAKQGTAPSTLVKKAHHLLVIVNQMKLQEEGVVRLEDIQAAAHVWACRQPQYHNTKGTKNAEAHFIYTAKQWLSFLGRLYQPDVVALPYAHLLQEYAEYMKLERGFSAVTIAARCRWIAIFFSDCCPLPPLNEISIEHIDQALAHRGSHCQYSRVSLQVYASALRAFFRYAELRGWCAPGLSAAIISPRIFKDEGLPAGPSWDDVQRLLTNTEGDEPANIRDRAVVMLFAIYGFRKGEVRRLRLEDLRWDQEIIRVTRSKSQRTQDFPLLHSVGEAILRYLKEVRARSQYREVFLRLRAPFRPLSQGALWNIVGRRLRQLDPSLKHVGPHSLRHACATRLMAQGSSLKEIGDQLGHLSPDVTRMYAKVDIGGLRQVADFDLGGLS